MIQNSEEDNETVKGITGQHMTMWRNEETVKKYKKDKWRQDKGTETTQDQEEKQERYNMFKGTGVRDKQETG
jgi:hypothetical protein